MATVTICKSQIIFRIKTNQKFSNNFIHFSLCKSLSPKNLKEKEARELDANNFAENFLGNTKISN